MLNLPLSGLSGGEVSEVVSPRGRGDDLGDAVEVEEERSRAISQAIAMEEEVLQHPLQQDDSFSPMLYPSPPSLPSAAASFDLHRSSPFLEVAACQAANQMEREEEGDVLNSDDGGHHPSSSTCDRRKKQPMEGEFISPPETPPPWADTSCRKSVQPARDDGDEPKMTAEISSTPPTNILHHDHTGAPVERIRGRMMTPSASPERREGALQEHQGEDMKKHLPATHSCHQPDIHRHPFKLREGAEKPPFLNSASGLRIRTPKEGGEQEKKPGEGEQDDNLLHDEVLFVGENDGVNCEKQREEAERREGGLSPSGIEEEDLYGRSSFYPDHTETVSSHPAGPVTSDPSSASHSSGLPLSAASPLHVPNGTRTSPLFVSSSSSPSVP
ncbi:hypothetical protein CSUI_005793, partial [Cystoisospora suis]